MSIRNGLLALLEQGPMYGYQLRTEFERRTGATWPLNIGQVYTTLARLERDGLVERGRAPRTTGRRVVYRITPAGPRRRGAWFATPVARDPPPRDELAIKLALALTAARRRRRARSCRRSARRRCARCRTTRGSRSAAGRRTRRPGLAAGAGVDGLPGRGRGALARPLRGAARAGALAPAARPATPGHGGPRRADRGGPAMTAVARTARRAPACTAAAPAAVHALRGVTLAVRTGRARRGHGPVGLRQVDAAAPRRRPRRADDRPRAASRAPSSAGSRPRARSRAACAARRRLRLPGPQPDPGPDRGRERRPAARARRDATARGPAGGAAALDGSGIDDLADRFPDELSGGQQQRVAIARALVGRPPARPRRRADRRARQRRPASRSCALLRARCDAGASGLLVTHEARHAAWADRVVFLRDGVIVDDTGRRRRPTTCSTRELLESGARLRCGPAPARDGAIARPPARPQPPALAADRRPGGAAGGGRALADVLSRTADFTDTTSSTAPSAGRRAGRRDAADEASRLPASPDGLIDLGRAPPRRRVGRRGGPPPAGCPRRRAARAFPRSSRRTSYFRSDHGVAVPSS